MHMPPLLLLSHLYGPLDLTQLIAWPWWHLGLIYCLKWFACFSVYFLQLSLAYFRQLGANQLLRALRAAFNRHFFVSSLLFLNCFLPGLFFLYGLLLNLNDSLFLLLFWNVFLDSGQFMKFGFQGLNSRLLILYFDLIWPHFSLMTLGYILLLLDLHLLGMDCPLQSLHFEFFFSFWLLCVFMRI